MRKFLTERDINEYVAQGKKELVLVPGTVVTDLGKERARAAGIRIVEGASEAQPVKSSPATPSGADAVQDRVRAAVIARLGEAPDGLDTIISRVLSELRG